MPFQHRFLSVLAPFWRAKMSPKSIKNWSKLSFRAFLFPHRVLHQFFIDFSSQLGPPGCPKSRFFLWKYQAFSKNRLSKITSISASILVPTCLHVGFQNRRFSEIMAFQKDFETSSFFVPIFLKILGPSWPPTWAHLGGQDGSNFNKMVPKCRHGGFPRALFLGWFCRTSF